ncbi:MAG: ImmA/IrrE family metallo-endopeptidase [Proteobacteria bacterium]|nr:ImmA/IrrE family metallo-endopeptidase [Pseudomonadota bacterium]
MSERLRRFCKYWNGYDQWSAANKAIARAFPDLPNAAPPIDLKALARRRGVRDVVYGELSEDGHIVESQGGNYIIVLNSAHPESRQRFTIAHEIAHTFFFEALGKEYRDPIDEVAHQHYDEEEKVCDYIATRLLLPNESFTSILKSEGFGAAAIATVSQKFRISLRATARRLVAEAPVQVAAYFWEEDVESGNFIVRWKEPQDRWSKRGDQQIVLSALEPAYQVFRRAEDFRGRYWLSLGGPQDRYFVDGFCLSNKRIRYLTLVVLNGAAERYFGLSTPHHVAIEAQGSLFD